MCCHLNRVQLQPSGKSVVRCLPLRPAKRNLAGAKPGITRRRENANKMLQVIENSIHFLGFLSSPGLAQKTWASLYQNIRLLQYSRTQDCNEKDQGQSHQSRSISQIGKRSRLSCQNGLKEWAWSGVSQFLSPARVRRRIRRRWNQQISTAPKVSHRNASRCEWSAGGCRRVHPRSRRARCKRR